MGLLEAPEALAINNRVGPGAGWMLCCWTALGAELVSAGGPKMVTIHWLREEFVSLLHFARSTAWPLKCRTTTCQSSFASYRELFLRADDM